MLEFIQSALALMAALLFISAVSSWVCDSIEED